MGYYLSAFCWLLFAVTGPGVMLFYPLYASLKALETPSAQDDRQWLTYWILFSFLTYFECACWKFLEWLVFWPFIKLGICIWLVLPSLNGAAYIYNNFVRKYVKIGSLVSRNSVGASSRQSFRSQVGASFRQSHLSDAGASFRQSPLYEEEPFPESPPRQSPPNEIGASSRQSTPSRAGSSSTHRSRMGALFRPRRR